MKSIKVFLVCLSISILGGSFTSANYANLRLVPSEVVEVDNLQRVPRLSSERVPVKAPVEYVQPAMVNATWVAQGPGPSSNGQVENVSPDNQVVGAVHALAAHPSNPDILYLGATNGGVWKTSNATAASPNWTTLTDQMSSLSIGSIDLDPTDATSNTIWAGRGRFSSFARNGGARSGLLKTTDGGASWTETSGGGTLTGANISGIAARGNTVVVAVDVADSFDFPNIGIFRSTDGGTSFSQRSVGDGTTTGLPGGVAYDLASNRASPSTLYTVINFADLVSGVNGIYKSIDTGLNWTKVSSAEMDSLIISNTTSNVEISVGATGTVNVAIINNGQLRNGGVFNSTDGGVVWTKMDTLLVNETGGTVGTNPRFKENNGEPGGQGSIHFSILTVNNILYVGGDRQPAGANDAAGFPNALGANDFSGRLFRGDSSVTATAAVPSPQWKHLTHVQDAAGMTGGGTASSSAPHADSREMVLDANGNLIEGDDGGIYRRTNPTSNTGDWFSIIGDLQVTEQHNVAYDPVSNIIVSGNQDTGTTYQSATGSKSWISRSTADGGDVAVSVDPDNATQSIRYSSFQNLGAFRKTIYDSAGQQVGPEVFPALSGASFSAQFVTPVEVNNIDADRLLIGGSSSLIESSDQGETTTSVASVTAVSGVTAGNSMVYGGRRLGVDYPNLIYMVTASDVYARNTMGGSLTELVNYPGAGPRGIIVDPEDWHTVVVITANTVQLSTDGGVAWQDITGNLTSSLPSPDIRSVDFIRAGDVTGILIGTNQGVFLAKDSNFLAWSKVGSNLPNAPVWDMDYDGQDDVLVVGTLGRGSWKLSNASQALFGMSEVDVDELCVPIKTTAGTVALICL